MGRPPVQPPTRINPAVGKLPKETVARIPLVLYIPSPQVASPDKPNNQKAESSHVYPPATHPEPSALSEKPNSDSPTMTKSIFRLFSKSSNTQRLKLSTNSGKKQKWSDGWEDQWEMGSYPFVRLSGTRATCHICLEEFDEPRKKDVPQTGGNEKHDGQEARSSKRKKRKKTRRKSTLPGEDPLKLEDAGDGAQPLRLLACGHVFHVSSDVRLGFSFWLTSHDYSKHASTHGLRTLVAVVLCVRDR